MGSYVRGDVILAPVPFDERKGAKTRPAVVVAARENGEVCVCPVSSRPPVDTPCIPIGLDDFAEGGLDLFSESFVLTSKVTVLRAGDVIGKKGRLAADAIDAISEQVPHPPGPRKNRKSSTRSSRK
ncbi:type II toxin-antitoxin system PemK/MazF family toxin [Methanoregula sp.]|uniref:type II toxin-antitoxin system PemK/MazF family toxin n=1 Tax=Methanoregula sp. TaxID=2052170 RepID=UPI0035629964